MRIYVYHEANHEMLLGTIDVSLIPDISFGSSVMLFGGSTSIGMDDVGIRVRLTWRDGELVAFTWDEHALSLLPTFRRVRTVTSGLLGTEWLTPFEALQDSYIKEGGVVALLIDRDLNHCGIVATETASQWRTIGRWIPGKKIWTIAGWSWDDQEWFNGVGTVVGVAKLPDGIEKRNMDND